MADVNLRISDATSRTEGGGGERKANPLHSHPRSKAVAEREGAAKKPATEEKAGGADGGAPGADGEKPGGYIAGESEPGATTMKRDAEAAGGAGGGAAAPAGDDDKGGASGGGASGGGADRGPAKDVFMEGMRKIRARHTRELEDHAGNLGEIGRQMHQRHAKEIADHFDMHYGSADGEKKSEGTPSTEKLSKDPKAAVDDTKEA